MQPNSGYKYGTVLWNRGKTRKGAMEGGTSDERSKEKTKEKQKTPPKPPPETAEAREQRNHQHLPPQKCPRCDSLNTKFCYYNNYSLAQPRYLCKACRRYWTHGGSIRNIPVGGGRRKAKRQRIASPSFANSEIPYSTAAISSQNLTRMISGQSLRPMPPAVSNSFYYDSGVLQGFSPMQSLQGGGMNQCPTVSYGGGPCRFGTNMTILQGMKISGYRNMPPSPQFHPPASGHDYSSQQSLSTWAHSSLLHMASGVATSGSACYNLAAESDPSGASFSQDRWPESDPVFSPP